MCGVGLAAAIATGAEPSAASDADPAAEPSLYPDIDTIVVTGRQPVTTTSTMTIPAESFELRPLESGGQMLEAVPNLVTAQHTGGGKAEQYFIRGFDADHGTDLAVYFDGVPINLRSHAHGQGFLDLHFVAKETIERLDAFKGPYFARYGDFATAAAVEYIPFDTLDESFVKFEGGSFETFRAVGALSSGGGLLASNGPAEGFLTFEAYHTDGPFENPENLWRYSALARGSVGVTPDLRLSGHLLGYYADWDASGLVPQSLVESGELDRFGSLDPTEGGTTARAQLKLQADWTPSSAGQLMVNAYVAWYDLNLYSNFTYFLENNNALGDGIVQRDEDRIYTGGRIEYEHWLDEWVPIRLRGGTELRYDQVGVVLGTQTRRRLTGCRRSPDPEPTLPCNDDEVRQLSVEPYVEAQILPTEWITVDLGLRFAWLGVDGRDRNEDVARKGSDDTLWLPKANLAVRPFSGSSPWASEARALRDLQLFGNFGIGYHSNDARTVFDDPDADLIPRATGAEVGFRTSVADRVEVALGWWWLELEEELLFIGDEGTTEPSGRSQRQGIEFVTTMWLTNWLYLRGDIAYTSARFVDEDDPIPQAPRFVARAATGVRWRGFAAELGVRHLGERYATEDQRDLRLSDYTVVDLAGRFRWRFLEIGVAIESLTNTDWSSSEFYYESRPIQGGPSREDFHFSPGNPINARAWISASF
jgi:outer membrane receptor protein involved in Fe transport